MKKDTVIIALAIGVAIFLMRWFRLLVPIEDYEIHFLPLFGIYIGLRWHFKKVKTANPTYNINFLRVFWLAIRMSLIAAIFTGLLCFLFISYPPNTIRMFPPLFLHSFPFTSTATYGILISIICSAVVVYFKPIKVKDDTDLKLNTGAFLY